MKSPFRQLLDRALRYRSLFTVSVVSNVIVAIATLASVPIMIPLLTMLFEPEKVQNLEAPDMENFSIFKLQEYGKFYMHKFFADKSLEDSIIIACVAILVVFLIKNVFQYIVYFTIGKLRNYVGRDLRNDMMDKILHLSTNSLAQDKKGDLITRVTSDVKIIEDSFLGVIETIFKSPLIVLGSIGIMLWISPTLTLYVFILLIFTVFVIGGISKALRKQTNAAQTAFGDLVSTLEESISGNKTVKAYHAQNHIQRLFSKKNDGYVDTAIKITFRRDLASPMSEFLGIVVVTILLWLGSRLVFSNQLDSSYFLTFIFAFYNIIDPAKKFSNASYRIQESIGAYDRILHLLDRSDERDQVSSEKQINKTDLKDSIEIKNLSFTYQQSEGPVLQDINMSIKKGMTIALVGQSGSGKSTLADLICRFLIPTSGEILIDGLPLKNIKEEDLRELVTLVQQEAILFNDTIKENVEFGYTQSSSQKLDLALDAANAKDFVDQMESTTQTNVGDGGNRLSGGQKQRLNLARALLRDSPILILDEATSALDSKSENLIQEALEKATKNRTSIIIAHRLTTIQNADRIFVLDQGKIVEQGTHEELISDKSGIYAKFVELQRLSE